jgi:hypothetical protein
MLGRGKFNEEMPILQKVFEEEEIIDGKWTMLCVCSMVECHHLKPN